MVHEQVSNSLKMHDGIMWWYMFRRKTIALSGGFDPIHSGHVRMIKAAAEKGDVIIILNSDDWLMRKKGYIFMTWAERAEILSEIKGVVRIIPVDDSDGTVCKALEELRPDYFGNGGDRTSNNTPEKEVCKEHDIQMVWNLGGGKIQSSSELVRHVQNEPLKSRY